MSDERPRLSTRQAAERAGVHRGNWTSWRSQGKPRGNPVPEPDGDFDGRPWWWPETVDAWSARRPGAPPQLRREREDG